MPPICRLIGVRIPNTWKVLGKRTATKNRAIIVDAGPLIALVSPRDRYHDSCRTQFANIKAPLFTCWPVLAEVAWLLRERPAAVQSVLSSCDGTFLSLLLLAEPDAPHLASLMQKYADQRMQLADAAIVYLADRENLSTIFTVDRRDFSIYRKADGSAFDLLPL